MVAHAISVTVMQARGGRAVLGRDEEAVRRALDAIEQTNTAALSDMRRLLAVLRDTEGADEGRAAPQPSLANLDRLVEQVRATGQPVELEVTGEAAVPPGDLSAYRIVQEALTNVIKHAGPGAQARVRVRYGADALEVAVADDGVGPIEQPDRLGGHGLVGIRERVAVVGGQVTAGPARTAGSWSPHGPVPTPSTATWQCPRRPRRLSDGADRDPRGHRMTIRVVIADDQHLVRSGLRMILSAEDDVEVVAEAADGEEAVAACEQERPDVVLMDVRMPGVDGIDATRTVTVGEDPPRVLVLTTFDLDDVVYEALRAGASGFLLKDAPEERLVTAIRVVAEAARCSRPRSPDGSIEEFARRRDGHRPVTGLETLTERETEVLREVARGLSNAEIAARLFVTENTVKTHVAGILMKLGLRDRVQAVVAAYEAGQVGR